MRAKVRGTEIFFDIEGMGLVPIGDKMVEKQVCFVVHGGPGVDHSSFKPWLSPLADYMQLVYVDHRGNGRSARGPIESYTLDNNVDDLDALREYLGLEKINVLGWSYGGFVSLTYAIRYPDRVSHLIALATSPCFDETIRRAKEIAAERATPEQAKHLPDLWAGKVASDDAMRESLKDLGPLYTAWNKPGDPRAEGEAGLRPILSHDALNYGFGACLHDYDVRADLGRITAPTLVLGAKYDWITPLDQSEIIAQGIPNSRLEVFEYSGHHLALEEPDKFFRKVRAFLIETGAVPLELVASLH